MIRFLDGAAEGQCRHWVALELEPFVVFNDDGNLTMEPVVDSDLTPVTAEEILADGTLASMAWSSHCSWYFVIGPSGIALLNTYTGSGVYCRKKSAMFIQWFLDRPRKRR